MTISASDEIRPDYAEKLTGQAKFITDLVVPGMAYAKVLRSPHPHARILSIDAEQALALPGVLGVLTGQDLLQEGFVRERHWGLYFRDRPIIAIDVARYAGEPVAAVIAADEATADDALELLSVEYEVLPYVVEPEAALLEDALLVHEQFRPLNDYYFRGGANPREGTNICHQYSYEQGQVDEAFESAYRCYEDTFRFPGIFHYALEPHCVIASCTEQDIEIWSCGQTPSSIQRVCAELFGIELARVRVHIPYVGGGFGGKASVKLDPLVVAMSRKVGRPVKLQLTAAESMLTCRRVSTAITVRTGVDREGRIIARDISVLANVGAYADTGPAIATKAAIRAIGPYVTPNLRLRASAVYTNTVPAASFRSIGGPQGVWACESQMDIMAHDLGISPVDMRRRNLAAKGVATKQDLRPIDVDVGQELTQALAMSEQFPKVGARGVALAATDPGIMPVGAATVRLQADGSITIAATTTEIGQGARGVQRLIAARLLNQPIERVHVLEPDTAMAPYDWGTGASRSTVIIGLAIELACEQIIDQVKQAAQAVEREFGDLALIPGGVRLQGREYSFKELLRAFYGMEAGEFAAIGRVTPQEREGRLKQAPLFWETAAGVCNIQLDQDTGEIRVDSLAISADVGKVLNPKGAQGQDEGAAVQALGHTLMEQYIYEDGLVTNGTMFDYRIPTMDQVPDMHTHFLESEDGPGPFGARGMGEGSILPLAPAVANALHQSYGIRLRDLPLTPERVWRALKAKKEQSGEL